MKHPHQRKAIIGSLIGTAIGDALGLPAEGLNRRAIARRWARLDRYHFVWGRGMFSDDTEHTLMLAKAWLQQPKDVKAFRNQLARSLRWWLLALPAGVGLGTARAIIRLWLGISPERSGVRSAGNGAAMRSAILGVLVPDDRDRRQTFVEAASRVTHTDERALEAAHIVAEAAAAATLGLSNVEILPRLAACISSHELTERWQHLNESLRAEDSVDQFASRIGCEKAVSGFAPNTVVVALYSWLRHRDDFPETLLAVIRCGGDTDTVAAIAGGIAGAEMDPATLPPHWIDGLCDWPRSVNYIRRLASSLADYLEATPFVIPSYPLLLVPIRNAAFLILVLLHGLRRLLPPY